MTDKIDVAGLRGLVAKATPGPWDVWRERTDTRDDAVAELTAQVESAELFAGAVFLLNADGKCPALTGCGPTSEANAALIVAAVNALPALLEAAEANAGLEGEVERKLRERVEKALDRAENRLGHVSIDAMEGDNLAVTLCSHFDDPDQEPGENGWTDAAVNGCDATMKAIKDLYAAELRAALQPAQDGRKE